MTDLSEQDRKLVERIADHLNDNEPEYGWGDHTDIAREVLQSLRPGDVFMGNVVMPFEPTAEMAMKSSIVVSSYVATKARQTEVVTDVYDVMRDVVIRNAEGK